MNEKNINDLINEVSALLKSKNVINVCKNKMVCKHLLEILTELANELILYKDGKIFCKYQYLLLWRKYTITLESDLLIIVFLVNQSIHFAEFDNRFDWKLIIDHDNEELNYILRKGLADNHYHLGGSLPVFQCIWTEVMKNELYRKNMEILFPNEKQLLKRAAWIRHYLIEFLPERSRGLIENDNLKGYEKYYEERRFLFYIIREFIQNDMIEISIKNLLYSYLIIKEQFRELIVQCGDNIGESSFFIINDKKNDCLKPYDNIGEIIKSSIGEQIKSNAIKVLEIRIKMQGSSFELYKYIKWLSNQINYPNTKVQYIICFSREITICDDIEYRNQTKIAELRKQINDLNFFLERYSSMAKQIVGIDVCSKENNYNPEVFSEIMIRKKNRADAKLRRMYHVGEKYFDLLSGLRSIDECICFFELGLGDRLGHAVPIFEKVDDWYNERNYHVTIFKEEHLDNMAWLYCNLPSKVQKGKEGKKILKDFKYLFNELYQSAFVCNTMLEFHHGKNIEIDLEDVNIYHYFKAWKMRRESPETIKNVLLKNVSNDNNVIIYYIAYCHFFNLEVRDRGRKEVNIHISNGMITLIQIAQSIVQEKIRKKGISIEVCPSSNILLGNIKKGYCHPLINLLRRTKNDLNELDICVSINTDNQGIFATSLMSEYSLLIKAFENERNINGDMIFSKDFLYKWVDKMRENSIKICSDNYKEK
jgi:Adenosine deaminase